MGTLIRTDHLPAGERLAHWRAAVRQLPVPFEVRADPVDFLARLTSSDLGDLNVLSELSRTPHEFFRTRAEIGWSDPEAYRLLLAVQGDGMVAHGHGDVQLRPGDLMLCDTSRPMQGWRGVGDKPVEWLMLTFARQLLPLPGKTIARLVGMRLAGQAGLASLVSSFLTQVAALEELHRYPDGQRLATVTLDLIAALLAHVVENDGVLSPWSPRHALILQIQDYITGRLGDPGLSPSVIAAAHHMSVRQLHRLFALHGQTVAAWIRGRRLEACRRDLADPLFGDQPAHVIAARWGLRDPAHFSRVFRAAYGLSPLDYRRRVAERHRGTHHDANPEVARTVKEMALLVNDLREPSEDDCNKPTKGGERPG